MSCAEIYIFIRILREQLSAFERNVTEDIPCRITFLVYKRGLIQNTTLFRQNQRFRTTSKSIRSRRLYLTLICHLKPQTMPFFLSIYLCKFHIISNCETKLTSLKPSFSRFIPEIAEYSKMISTRVEKRESVPLGSQSVMKTLWRWEITSNLLIYGFLKRTKIV